MASGHSGIPLAKKRGIEEVFKVLLVDEPEYYPSWFDELPQIVIDLDNREFVDFIHFFALKLTDLELNFDQCKSRLVKMG